MSIIRNTCAILTGLFALISVAHANTSVIGLEIGKSTIEDVKSKYKINYSNPDASEWVIPYVIEPSDINIEGLNKVVALIKKDDGKLSGVVMIFNKSISRFDELADSLQKKYKVTSVERPHVGDAHVYLQDGDTLIELEAPHMSFIMTLSYIDKNVREAAERKSNQEAQQKKQAEEDLL